MRRREVPWSSLGLAAAGGATLAASLPPWPVATGAWYLGPLGAALVFVALLGRRVWGRLAVGMTAGLGLYLPGLWWMREFSLPGFVLATLLQAAILAVALVVVPTRPGQPTARAAVAFPLVLVLAGAFRAAWPFGGLPLAGLELGQMAGPLAHAARLGGGALVVALVGAAGGGLALMAGAAQPAPVGGVKVPAGRRRVAGVVALAASAAVALAGGLVPAGAVVGRREVAVVQGGGVRGLSAADERARTAFDAQVSASREVRPPVDLVLWPEDVVDVDVLEGSEAAAVVSGLARDLAAVVVAGVVETAGPCPRPEGVCRFSNTAVSWESNGRRSDRTDKVHRVPFGEYIPGRALVARLGDVSAVPRDALVGKGPGALSTGTGRLGVIISYEVFFADRARAAVDAGGTVILVPTNASSFGDAQVPAQQLAAARLRALETGRWVVQAAPTGYSAVIDHRGRVRSLSRLGASSVLEGTIELRSGSSPVVLAGPWALPGAASLALAANAWMGRTGRRRSLRRDGDRGATDAGPAASVG
ncbi:MAG: apolipoprotein N-acyltransferase [Acidimicrobiales bacterium]